MGLSHDAVLVFGVPLSKVKKTTYTEVDDVRYDPKTGVKIEFKRKIEKVTLLGKEVGSAFGPDEWLGEFDEKVLEVFSSYCEVDESEHILGIGLCTDDDNNPRAIDAVDMCTRFNLAIDKYGLDAIMLNPTFYLMSRVG